MYKASILKECPFCGASDHCIEKEYIGCNYCGARGPLAQSFEIKKDAWEKRMLDLPKYKDNGERIL